MAKFWLFICICFNLHADVISFDVKPYGSGDIVVDFTKLSQNDEPVVITIEAIGLIVDCDGERYNLEGTRWKVKGKVTFKCIPSAEPEDNKDDKNVSCIKIKLSNSKQVLVINYLINENFWGTYPPETLLAIYKKLDSEHKL